MSAPSNLFQTVVSYQKAELAALQNYACLLSTFEKKFKDFQNFTGNLGTSVTFDTPPRAYAANTLDVIFETSQQYTQTLTVDQPFSVGRAITAEQLIYNDMGSERGTGGYMVDFGRADIMEIGGLVEKTLGLNFTSSVPVRDAKGNPTGALHHESGPYRCYGNGNTAITSYQQLAQFVEDFKEIGVAGKLKVYLPSTYIPAIIGSGLNQFVPQRNEKSASSWFLGDFDGVSFYRSNLFPTFTAGTIGQAGTTLTVVSTDDPTGANITSIVFSGAGTDANAIKAGDIFTADVSNGLFFVTEYGHVTTSQKVQFRARDNAASSGNNVTVPVAYLSSGSIGLVSDPSQNQNINTNLVAGMTFTVANSAKVGAIVDEGCAFLAMPRMPATDPWTGSNANDPKTGATIRSYYGMLPFQNQYGYAHDCVMGSTMVPRRCAQIRFPLS